MQRLGDEFIDLVAHLAAHAGGNAADGGFGVNSTGLEGHGVEEGINQPHRHGAPGAGIDAIDGVGEHRVAKAIHNIGKFRHDGRVYRAVVAGEDFE